MSEVKTLSTIRKIGISALAEALGLVGMVRFIQSFELGSGDYTKERSRWLDQSTEEIVVEISRTRAKKTEP